MSKLRDFQRVFVDNIANDIDDIFCEHLEEHLDSIIDAIKLKLESRIESYDRERKEQIIRDMVAAAPRWAEEVVS